ncbi:MAG: VanZ family protein [Candidatus Omnitrophica bacterium]|nr:VanZ family protein [Candidatus Omnitrophota bacterium]MDD5237550.1 VanZ family protein [Candidatus Omnitrophota bacterium]
MELSKVTVGAGVFIIISASFMNQVWVFLEKVAGSDNLVIACASLFAIFSIFVLAHAIKSKRGFLMILLNLTILSLVFVFAWQQPPFDERMHVLEYGFLGWLTCCDLNKYKSSLVRILLAFLFVLLIGASDEAFQVFLPYRTGDIKDVIVNAVSGAFGITLFLVR